MGIGPNLVLFASNVHRFESDKGSHFFQLIYSSPCRFMFHVIYIVIEKMTELVNLFGTATFISICREWWRQRSDGNWWNCLEDPEMGNWIKAPRLHWLLRIKTNQMWFPQATRTSTIQLIQHVENKHSHWFTCSCCVSVCNFFLLKDTNPSLLFSPCLHGEQFKVSIAAENTQVVLVEEWLCAKQCLPPSNRENCQVWGKSKNTKPNVVALDWIVLHILDVWFSIHCEFNFEPIIHAFPTASADLQATICSSLVPLGLFSQPFLVTRKKTKC